MYISSRSWYKELKPKAQCITLKRLYPIATRDLSAATGITNILLQAKMGFFEGIASDLLFIEASEYWNWVVQWQGSNELNSMIVTREER
jgi:hypothetical protein